jgi:hypothetical protein
MKILALFIITVLLTTKNTILLERWLSIWRGVYQNIK